MNEEEGMQEKITKNTEEKRNNAGKKEYHKEEKGIQRGK